MKASYKLLKSVAQNYRVLYVEDDAVLQETTGEFFEGFFKEVVRASDGKQALALYTEFYDSKKEYFDIVISDIQMPNMDGVLLSRAVIQKNKQQKIIIVSAYNETEYFIELIRIGVSGFMQKPLTSTQMLEILYEVCMELEEEREVSRYVDFGNNFVWDTEENILRENAVIVNLTSNERLVLELFITNPSQTFTDIDIFNHIHIDNFEKEFSSNAIKSLLKRLRKKIPKDLILTHKNLGYRFKI